MTKYANTSYRRYQRVKARQADIFNRARSFHLTHDAMLAERVELFGMTDYRKLTYAQRFALSELWQHMRDAMYVTALEWRTGPASGPIPFNGEWSEELSALSRTPGALYGAHFYIGTDKPFAPYQRIN